MSDLMLDSDGDFMLNAAGDDLVTVSGAALVAADVREAVRTPLGSLPWDRDAGSNVLQWLLLESVPEAAVIAELERVAVADNRVDAATVRGSRLPDGSYRLRLGVRGGGEGEVVVDA